jgi:hypothetical protein
MHRPPGFFLAAAFLLGCFLTPRVAAVGHVHVSPDGHETTPCTCRPATEAERGNLGISPDGWVQDEPRASYSRGTVPLPLVPDWVGTRIRATGGLAWGDADADGDLDLAVGTYFANQYPPLADYYNFIYLNQGGVLEANPSWISADQVHTSEVVWGDFNGDQRPDMFCANGGSSLSPSQVFYGQAGLLPTTAGWQSATSAWATGGAAADFDRDGDLDVATSNQGSSSSPYRPTYLFRNSGAGLQPTPFWQSNQVGITGSVAWGDLDGDQYPELAVSGWSSWQSGVFHNLGTTLDPAFAWTSGHPERTDKGVGWSDVDGDGHADLVVGGNGAPDWLFHNEGNMLGALPVWSSGESFHGCQKLRWVDIDRDGDEDLATIHFTTGHVRVYLNNGGVLSTIADWQYQAASGGTALAFGDLDGDTMPDLAIGMANGPIEVFLNTGEPTGVSESAAGLPGAGARLAAWPNPFTDRVTFRFQTLIASRGMQIEVFDPAGRRVSVVAGHEAALSATDEDGSRAESDRLRSDHAGLTPRRTRMTEWRLNDGARDLSAGVYTARATATDESGRTVTAVTRMVRLGR